MSATYVGPTQTIEATDVCVVCNRSDGIVDGTHVCDFCHERLVDRCQTCNELGWWQRWDGTTRTVADWQTRGAPHYRPLTVIVHERLMQRLRSLGLAMYGVTPDPMCEAWALLCDEPVRALNLGARHLNVAMLTNEGRYVCEDCAYTCDDCGELHASEDSAHECCNYHECGECGEHWETYDEATTCCNPLIHGYGYTPMLTFYASPHTPVSRSYARPGTLFMGIELEMEHAAPFIEDFYAIEGEDYRSPTFVWAKSDGSLGADGVELVTMPATIDAIRGMYPWDGIKALNASGARAYHQGTCGMHIHCARASFTPTHMWRFVQMQMRNQSLCEMVAQRSNSSWAKWSPLGEEIGARKLPAMIKGTAKNGDRYVAINFQPEHTIELRYFRANLLIGAIASRIEFVQSIYDYTLQMSVNDVRNGAMSADRYLTWVQGNEGAYSNLARYLTDHVEIA